MIVFTEIIVRNYFGSKQSGFIIDFVNFSDIKCVRGKDSAGGTEAAQRSRELEVQIHSGIILSFGIIYGLSQTDGTKPY